MARLTPDPTFYASPSDAASGPRRDARIRRRAQHGHERRQRTRRADRPRPRGRLPHLRPARRPPRHAERRRRAAPLRLERLLVRALPVGRAPARRAPLPARAGPALLAHPHRRRQGRPAQPDADEGHRGRGDREQDRLLAPAHDPLRPRRDLRLRARRPRRRRPGRHLPARPRELLGQGRLGAGPRAAGAGLRLLVAPQPGHGHHLRVGHAEHGRERPPARAAAEQPVRPQAPHLGPREAQARPGDRPRRPSTRWCSSCGRRTTRARPTGSSAWSPRPPTCPPRCGCGSATATARSRPRR